MRIALYQPDIPQNTGTILRMAACFAVPVHVIGPAGFDMSDRSLKRAGLDYLQHVSLSRHADWAAFQDWRLSDGKGRLVLLTTKGATPLPKFAFDTEDVLMLGRESAGVPDSVHDMCDARVRIPIAPGLRSLNIAVAAAVALGEGLRQTGGFPR